MYSLIRPFLFMLDGERSHHAGMNLACVARRLGMLRFYRYNSPTTPSKVFGLTFPNPVGLAAGFDKNANYLTTLGKMGFGYVEVGTVTPRPQIGNPKPRLFRIPQAQAIVNRMGFNNAGVDHLVRNVERAKYKGILGINIGKNADTPMEQAHEDYLTCMDKVYEHADYITINISSPNTANLRDLQHDEALYSLLSRLLERRETLIPRSGVRAPLIVKISPDLDQAGVETMARTLERCPIDGLIATNTTLSRDGVGQLPNGDQKGGLSGAPLREQSMWMLRLLRNHIPNGMPIVSAGGIMNGNDVLQRLAAGASLVQLYSGLIYRGPGLVGECVQAAEARKQAPTSLHRHA